MNWEEREKPYATAETKSKDLSATVDKEIITPFDVKPKVIRNGEKKKRQKPPQWRERQLNKLPIQSGFKGNQKVAMSLIMRGITSSIRENFISRNRATQALENVQKVIRPK